MTRRVLLLAGLLTAIGGQSLAQQPDDGRPATWPEQKCAFYAGAWKDLLARSPETGITDAFIRGNEAFIAAGCSNGADVCPASPGDIELANQLTVAAMNFGTASSFLPFVCRQAK